MLRRERTVAREEQLGLVEPNRDGVCLRADHLGLNGFGVGPAQLHALGGGVLFAAGACVVRKESGEMRKIHDEPFKICLLRRLRKVLSRPAWEHAAL